MKRLIASALAVLLCLTLCVAILYADPGDGSTPPPPEQNGGLWTSPDGGVYTTTSEDDSSSAPCDTCDENGGQPWVIPDP